MPSNFTWRQEDDFFKNVFTFSLDGVIGWIKSNLNPEDVFDDVTLEKWADDHNRPLQEWTL